MQNALWTIFALLLTPSSCRMFSHPNCDWKNQIMRCERAYFSKIPEPIPRNCKQLLLTDNMVQFILQDDFIYLEEIEVINLKNNQISYIHPQAFQNLFRLEKLILQNNKIKTIQRNHFQNLASITLIDLTSNPVESIQAYAFSTINNNRSDILLPGKWAYCGCAHNKDNQGCGLVQNYTQKCADKQDAEALGHKQICGLSCEPNHICTKSNLCSNSNSVCKITFTRSFTVGWSVKHSCSNYDVCMVQMQTNKVTCSSKNFSVCAFCCIGNSCEQGRFEYLIKNITFIIHTNSRCYKRIFGAVSSILYKPRSMQKHYHQCSTTCNKGCGMCYPVCSGAYKRNLAANWKEDHGVTFKYEANILAFQVVDKLKHKVLEKCMKICQLSINVVEQSTTVNKYCRQDGIWNRTLIGEKFKVDCSTDLNNGIVKRKVRICGVAADGSPSWLDVDDRECDHLEKLGHCNTSGVWPGVSVGKTSKAACSAPSGIKGTKFRKCATLSDGTPYWHIPNYEQCGPKEKQYDYEMSGKIQLCLPDGKWNNTFVNSMRQIECGDSFITRECVELYNGTAFWLEPNATCEEISLNSSATKMPHVFCKTDGIWKQTPVGEVGKVNCSVISPHYGIRMKTRKCVKSDTGYPSWLPPDYSECIKNELDNMIQKPITDESAKVLVSVLMNVTDTLDSVDTITFTLVVEAFEKLGTLNNMHPMTTKRALSAVSTVLALYKDDLHSLYSKIDISQCIINAVDHLLLNVSLDNETFIYMEEELAAAAFRFHPINPSGVMVMQATTPSSDSNTKNTMVVQETRNVSGIDRDIYNTVFLPQSLFESLDQQSENNSRVTFTVYKDDRLFYDPKFVTQNLTENVSNKKIFTQVNSEIVSAKIPNTEIKNLKDPVLISFIHSKKKSNRPQCVYWSNRAGNNSWGWSTDGCIAIKTGENFTTCECYHLTHFALIMDVYNEALVLSQTDDTALFYISYIGCGMSSVALLFTILTYAVFRKLRQDIPSRILVNLCLALLATNLIFVFGMQQYTFHNKLACKIVAAMMHYFLLSALTWMAVEAVNMYLSLVIVFMSQIRNLVLKYMCFGWGIPLIIVIATAIYQKGNNYALLESGICWIKNPVFYVSFLAPVGTILLLNSIVFVLVLRQIIGVSSGIMVNKSTKTKIRTRLNGAVIMITLLGLTYLFAIFAIHQASVIFYYLFAIFNSLQGLFIFIFYCILKSASHNAWKSKLKSYYTSKEDTLDFGSSSTAQSGSHRFSRFLQPGSTDSSRKSTLIWDTKCS